MSEIIEWGDTKEDVDSVCEVLTAIQEIGAAAHVADSYTAGIAEFRLNLRGQATMLGLAIPARVDAIDALVALLTASRDHEGETSEAMIATARGKSGAEKSAIHLAASVYSGRRGWLDSAVYAIRRGAEKLEELRVEETKKVS